MAKIPLAVVGYGHMSSQSYCPMLHSLAERIGLAALVETDEERRAQGMDIYAFGGGFASVREMLAARKPRAALVLVPATAHYEVIAELLEAGVDVYTEKPDTHHLAAARELVALAKERRCVYQVGQNRLFLTALRRAKEFFGETPVDFAHVEKSKPERRTDSEYLLDDGLHVLSPLLWLAGEVAEVLGAVCVPERLLSAHLRLASGGAATLTMHLDSGYWVERFLLHGPGKSANVVTPDVVELYQDGHQVGDSTVGRLPLLFNPASLLGFQAAVDHFLDCVGSRAEPVGSAASLLRVHEVMNEVFARAGIPTL